MKRNLLGYRIGILLFCLLCIPFTHIWAKEPTSFQIGLDYACFRDFGDTTQSYVEIYYSFNRKELEFVLEKEAWVATVLMQLSISDVQGNVVENRMWNTWTKVEDAEKAKNVDYMIIDQAGTNLKPGSYQVTLQAADVNSTSHGEATMVVEAKKISEEKLQLSDMELAFSIETDTSEGRLAKAGKKILPNPSRVFTHEGGMVYFYSELYNLVDTPGAKPNYELRFEVLDATGKKVKDFGKQTKTKPGNSAVVISGINISTLAGGEYILKLEAKDKETGKKAYSSKKFVVIRELTEEELIVEETNKFKQDVVYIVSRGELDMFDQLNFSGKRSFIAEFWRRRDTDPETPENEFKIEHYRRINFANFHFSRTRETDDGWNTDMGRIYILYGSPSEIERHVSTRGAKPWEQWNYHQLEGGVYFIFMDEDGYGVYRLVHSNHKGEIYDRQWEDRLKAGSMD